MSTSVETHGIQAQAPVQGDALLAAIVDSSDDAIVSKSLDGIILSWNKGAQRIFGYTAEEVIGKHISILAVPERVEEIPDILARIRRGERVEHYETKRRTKDGRVLTISLTVSPIRNAEGEIVAASKIARDITERRRLSDTLTAQNEILELVARGVSLEEVSTALCKAVEFQIPCATASILVVRKSSGKLQLAAAPSMPDWYRDELAAGIPIDSTAGACASAAHLAQPVVVTDIAADPRWEAKRDLPLRAGFRSCWSHPILSQTGRVLGTLATYHRDSRAPREDETATIASWLTLATIAIARLQSETAVRESEFRFRALAELGPAIVWTARPDGSVDYNGRGWYDYTGLSPDELTGWGWLNRGVVHTQDASGVFENWARSVKTGQPYEREARFRRADGEYRWHLVRAVPQKDASGEVVRWLGILLDSHDRRESVARIENSERQLAIRERYLNAVLESIPECVKVLGRNGELLEMNRAGAEMIEADRADDLIGTCVYPMIDAADREAFRALNEGVFQGNGGDTLEFGITGLKGGHHVFDTRVVPLRNERDEVVGALSTTRDITDRRKGEDALRASEARFRAAVSAFSSLVWSNNSEGKMEGEQPGWAAYTGQTYEEYQGYGWANAVHREDARQTIEAWSQAVANKEMFIFEHRVRRYDGEYRLFAIRAVPVIDSSGKIREWVGVHTDITGQRRLMEERKEALRREQDSRKTAEVLNRVGALLAADLDTQSLTQTVTDLATQLTGAQFGSLFHNVIDAQGESYMLYTLSGVPREKFANFPMPRNTRVFAPTFSGEGVVRSDDIRKDPRYGQNAPHHGMPKGHLPVRSYLAVPVVSRSGEVIGGLFFGHEETGVFTLQHEELVKGIAGQAAIALDNARLFAESQNARTALEQSNQELRRANTDLEQFAFSASHDLQEPLRMVALYSQLLRRKYGDKIDKTADQYLAYIVTGGARMQQLVTDLLAFTRATKGPEAAIVDLDANVALDHALLNLDAAIGESGAEVTRSPLPTLPIVELHLEQLFQNLISNSIKYRSPEPPLIHVAAERDDAAWRFSVQDNGIGIDEKYAQQVFGLFRRLHTAAEYEGTGIGLAICERIVQRYGGKIWVESQAGKGATFFFTIPDKNASSN